MRRSASLFLVSSLLVGCVPKMAGLPPVPREGLDRLRQSVGRLAAPEKPIDLPERPDGPPPADLACSQAEEDPTLWLCVGDPVRMGGGAGLFFAYDGAGKGLAERLAEGRALRKLAPVLEERIEARNRALLASVEMLEIMALTADEYRTIAVVRGEEIERLQRDRIVDRITLFVPLAAIGAGLGWLFVK